MPFIFFCGRVLSARDKDQRGVLIAAYTGTRRIFTHSSFVETHDK